MDTTTSSTAAEHQVPVATICLGQHMLDNGLPHYTDVRLDTRRGGQPRLQVFVYAHGFDAWVESMHIDELTTEPFSESTLYEFALAAGRLPDTGVRVQVRCVRRVERSLSVVAS